MAYVANSGWTSVKIYSGTSASGTLLATRLRSQASFSHVFFRGLQVGI